jgi:hypothetical protein
MTPTNSPSVWVNSKRLAEFISEKISAEYDGWKSKSEIHGEAYRKRHPKPSHEGEKG